MSNKDNVTAAKPKTGGAVWVAPVGTTLPTSASASLDAGFTSLGYISDAGATNDNTPNVTSIKAWGGDTVLDLSTEKSDQWKFTLIEATNVDVLKFVYGDDNVTGTLATGITVTAKNAELEEKSVVIDTILKGGTAKRVVLPAAVVTAVGTITYADNSALGYETTVNAHPDSSDNTHYEYLVAASNG